MRGKESDRSRRKCVSTCFGLQDWCTDDASHVCAVCCVYALCVCVCVCVCRSLLCECVVTLHVRVMFTLTMGGGDG